ncbi:MAG: hypothetical protein Q8L98_00330 [Chlamydiales bacterium]|nr:hypothetical protein [Chlamydiales bacterium]
MVRLLFLFLIILRPSFCGLYISPDLFYRSFKELTGCEGKSEESGWLPGIQAGFDYENPWGAYLGGDVRFAEGQTFFDGTIQHHVLKKFIPFQSYTDNTLFNMEGRLGYTLAYKTIQCSPFFAIGFQKWARRASDKETGYDEWFRWNYLAAGMRWHWRYSQFWEGGFFFHLMRMKTADVQIRGISVWPIVLTLPDEWQAEAELPFSWNYSTYSVSWVGYIRYLPIGKSESQKMPKGELFLPASITYVLGNRLEFTVQF